MSQRTTPNEARVRATTLALCAWAWVSPARAQDAAASVASRTAAEELFEAARRDLRAGRTAEACPKLEESQRLDAGLGTLLHLGECYERLGWTASAWTAFREAIALARASRDVARERLAQERADALLPRLPRIAIQAPAARPRGLSIAVDGAPLPEARWGVAVPLNPGPHVVTASAPAHRAQSFDIVAEAKKTSEITISPLTPEEPAQPTAAPSPAIATTAAAQADVVPAANPPRGRWTTPTLLLAASSGVALAAGGVFGVRALRAWNASRPHCDAENACDPPGLDAIDRAKSSATLATAFLATGAVLGATTAVLWWSSPRHARVSVGPTSLSLALRWP